MGQSMTSPESGAPHWSDGILRLLVANDPLSVAQGAGRDSPACLQSDTCLTRPAPPRSPAPRCPVPRVASSFPSWPPTPGSRPPCIAASTSTPCSAPRASTSTPATWRWFAKAPWSG
ncbi:hypothetical protein JY96_00040 [Aquabacterium sp. NJ1]|nr:hypothetical protein JY96_00040 [Aquabacterium sp. NJ1]